ncbi:unnamed protein product [Dicrocoelium dendriticum]|nr:unnamed protein product [Dicrocoelium dendriticum]
MVGVTSFASSTPPVAGHSLVGETSRMSCTTSETLIKSDKLSCMYTNAQGLLSKINELRLRQVANAWDLISITETWLHQEVTDAEVEIAGMSIIRNDRPSRGGGVLLYYRSDLQCTIVEDLETHVTDSLWCRLRLRHNDTCLIAIVYRPPTSTLEMDSCLIRGLNRVTRTRYSHTLISGDFNLHNLEVSASPSEQFKADLQELIANIPLYNHVTTPTRFRTANKPSILDLVLTNEELMIEKLLMDSPLGLSDHVVITFDYVCYAEYPAEQSELTHTITRYHVLKELADEAAWEFSNKSPLDNVWAEFVNKLSDIVNKASETKPLRPAKMHSIIRSRTRKCLAIRDAAWRAYKINPDSETWGNFLTHRNHCTALVREDKITYQQCLAKKFMANNKLLYKHVNKLRKVKHGIPPLFTTGGRVQSAEEAANALRLQYAPIFELATSTCPIISSSLPTPLFTNVIFNPSIVLRKLLSLREHSSPGADNIRPKALKAVANKLAEPLSQFFQRCFDEQRVPTMWKCGIITPIFKGGSRSDPANYRPVTLLPVLAKVMEAVVAEALMDYLEKCNILVVEQHGFRQHRSCTTNLLIARGSWTEVADDGVGVDVIYLDFSKAFDRLDHRILLQRLQSYGIGDPVLGWIGNFLYQRKLQVRVRGSLSNPIEVECGVPQGSVLGPRLFLVFINDLARVISSNFLLFADDVKIWRAISNKADQDLLQHDLDCIYEWSKSNKLQLNMAKCKVMHLRHQLVSAYKIGDHTLAKVSHERDLGVLVQEDLGCSKQAEKATRTGNQHFGLLRRAFGRFEPSIFPQMLNAYVRPHVEYAIQAWQPWQKQDLIALETPQRRATKNVRGLFHLPYQLRLKSLRMYSSRYRLLRGDLIMVYQILKNPNHICRPLLELNPNIKLRGHPLKLTIHYSRLECRRNFFSLRVCEPWNALPNYVVSAPNLAIFKKRVDDALSHLHFIL